MKHLRPIHIDAAKKLINYEGKSVSSELAAQQLDGAVAIYNILAKKGFAYLADEVGMGKTYVTLGVISLLKFFHPGFRVLYLAPRENIQRKWVKELRNFTAHNWLEQDQRVRSLQNTPADNIALCPNLSDWARQTVRNHHQDCFLRLTSFSFPLPKDTSKWLKKRNELIDIAPMLDDFDLSLRNKDSFKRSYAAALNSILPHYDLVVIDEAHNLKHGRQSSASRNELLAQVLGTHSFSNQHELIKRFDRVLFLSATPLESDFKQLWNQLDLMGVGNNAQELCDPEQSNHAKQEAAKAFTIRRGTNLTIAGKSHTKNMYRREWRQGGVHIHDEALEVPSAKERLIVALVQKKVAEVLQDERFGNRFQMGMLASFESFLQTAKVAEDETETSSFDDAQQTESDIERQGIDSTSINQLAASYRETFGSPLPHPKMDAVSNSLSDLFTTGEKSLVFVRRVRTVPELSEKLCREYDAWLFKTIRKRLPNQLQSEFNTLVEKYQRQIRKHGRMEVASANPTDHSRDAETDEPELADDPTDNGGMDTFFSWFFRGFGPKGWLSGAAYRKNRIQNPSAAYSTLFEDNYVGHILGVQAGVLPALAQELGLDKEELRIKIRSQAFQICKQRGLTGKRLKRFKLYHAYQKASLQLLATSTSALAKRAAEVLVKRYGNRTKFNREKAPDSFPMPDALLDTTTLFTELRLHPDLCADIWPGGNFPESDFINMETRRELLSAATRLGHSFVDLWLVAVASMQSLRIGATSQEAESSASLPTQFVNLLKEQKGKSGFHAYRELSEIGKNHDLIVAVNFPEVRRLPLTTLPRMFAETLGSQMPVAGMFGGVNQRGVKQFRMPGYPFVLISTDVLQEGEDLHTFCARVIHYGISWTPSSMEQRTGRIDRIGSLVHRRLDGSPNPAKGTDKLQVYYPYLPGTVEVLQVERVLERMNQFMQAVHIGADQDFGASHIHVAHDMAQIRQATQAITTPLTSAFPVEKSHLLGKKGLPTGVHREVRNVQKHFDKITKQLSKTLCIEERSQTNTTAYLGTVFVNTNRLLLKKERHFKEQEQTRHQPFGLYLRTSQVSSYTLLRVVSPIGHVRDTSIVAERLHHDYQSQLGGLKLCAIHDSTFESYNLTVEGDILFTPETAQLEEVIELLTRATLGADWHEASIFHGYDGHFEKFGQDLAKEMKRVPR
jgi:hypothetical protein